MSRTFRFPQAHPLLALLGMATPLSVVAQETASPPARTGTIEEIVVTAQHRSERLSDVPIAITAATAEQMEAQGVSDAFDIGKITPSFSTGRVVGFGTPFMRGVGTTNVVSGDEPSVATYVDGFYQGLGIAMQLPFNNVERIEVLKGPQGTLYGRNAVGGLVNIVTRSPQQEVIFEGSAGYGRYDTWKGNAYLSGGLSDTLAADLAVTVQNQGEGFNTNILDGRDYGTNDYLAARSKFAFEFGDGGRFVFGLEYADSKNNLANVNGAAPGTVPLASQDGSTYSDRPHEFAATITPRFDVEQYGANARLDLELSFATLVSLTQYREITNHNAVEGDGSSSDGVLFGLQEDGNGEAQAVVPLSFFYIDTQKLWIATQEFQLVSNDPGPLKWITGAYLQTSRDGYEPLNINFSTMAPPLAIIERWQKTLALAAFAQSTYLLDNGVALTGGVRYSRERKTIGGDVQQLGETGYDTFSGEQSTWFNSFTFRLAADYHVNDDLLLFATVNKGFKSGLYNPQNIGAPPVDPETLYAYEVGFKLGAPKIRLDGSLYYYDYRDIQTFTTDSDGLTLLQNAGGAEMYGAELSLEANLLSGLSLRSSVGVENAEYQSFPDAEVYYPSPSGGNYPTGADVSGNNVIRTPQLTANFSASYFLPVGSAGSLTLNGSVSYTDSFYWDLANEFEQEDYALIDASARFTTADEQWSLTLWGRNLGDEDYQVYHNPTQRYNAVAWGDPVTFGISVGYRY